MQEHEYKARDKTVQKMSRDGLREKNLRSKKEKRITGREADEKKTAGHREQELDFGKVRKTHTAEETVEEVTEGKHRLQSRHAFLEQEEIAEAEEMENSEMSDDKAGGEKSPSVSRSRLRKESIRGHPVCPSEFMEKEISRNDDINGRTVTMYNFIDEIKPILFVPTTSITCAVDIPFSSHVTASFELKMPLFL